MNKKIKKIFFGSSLLTASFLPVTIISAGETNSNNEKPKDELSPKFPEFKKYSDEKTKEAMKIAIENAVSYFKNKKEKFETLTDKDYKEKIEAIYYFNELINFLDSNKNDMLENPYKYNLFALTPRVLAENTKFKIHNIKYNDKLYKNIKTGLTSPTDYKNALGEKGKFENPEDANNAFSEEEFKKIIDKYSEDLVNEFTKITFNEKDVLKLESEIFLKSEPGQKGFTVEFKKEFKDKYETIDKYFLSKIKDRFIDFDLKQNEEAEKEEEEKQPETNPSEKSENSPLVPNDSLNKETKQKQQEIIESLPELSPIISYDIAELNIKEIYDLYNSSAEEQKEKLFFFNNSINTRFSYTIESLEIKDEKLYGYVKIQDRVEKGAKRGYKSLIDNNPFDENISFIAQTDIFYNQYITIKDTFLSFYNALLLDDTINYSNLRNQDLIDAVSSMVDTATKIAYGDPNQLFVKNQKDLIIKLSKEYNVNNNTNQSLISKSNNQIKYDLLNALSNSKINENPYWYTPIEAFRKVYVNFGKAINANLEDIIKPNFENRKFNLNVIKVLYENIEKTIFRAKSITFEQPININKWYEEYLAVINKIQNDFNILSTLTSSTKIPENANNEEEIKNIENYENAYQKALESIKETNREKAKTTKIIGSTISTISILLFIVSLILLIINIKVIRKNKKLLTIYIGLIVTSVTLITIGIALLLVI
ncbi:Uncharacterised protein [Mycoplasmopsis maculosa]|uniref:Transmembrane protein n=1 Tax=Mycoplasmopsis maculosa TaxID=114885 RepID=A0A449B572_9BACT|nr:hypothetical protein [Mycoplasmopsis maculosa]VEU75719.1 Uncharacterised protein [Mycoplasmopsis maculosa]